MEFSVIIYGGRGPGKGLNGERKEIGCGELALVLSGIARFPSTNRQLRLSRSRRAFAAKSP